jgi:hypothetical protein
MLLEYMISDRKVWRRENCVMKEERASTETDGVKYATVNIHGKLSPGCDQQEKFNRLDVEKYYSPSIRDRSNRWNMAGWVI